MARIRGQRGTQRLGGSCQWVLIYFFAPRGGWRKGLTIGAEPEDEDRDGELE